MDQELKEKLQGVGCIVWIVLVIAISAFVGWAASNLNVILGVVLGIVSFVLFVWRSYQILEREASLDVKSYEGEGYHGHYEEY